MTRPSLYIISIADFGLGDWFLDLQAERASLPHGQHAAGTADALDDDVQTLQQLLSTTKSKLYMQIQLGVYYAHV